MAQFLTPPKKNMTIGEKRFADLLKRHLDDDYLVWFDIPTNSRIQRFPDFLIFNPNYGLWCIEVKDWAFGNAKKISPTRVVLKQGDALKECANPLEQARLCFYPIINQLKQDKQLTQATGKYKGNLIFPWHFGAVMTRWKVSSLSEKHKHAVLTCLPEHKTFFSEEITGEALHKEAFIEKLHGILPYRFGQLTKEQADRVRAHIFPEFIIEQKSLFTEDETMKMPDAVAIMDNHQEIIARNMGNGHRVIHGVAGSGKTILLEHRAKMLAENNPNEEILVTCFNIVLASRLRQRLNDDNIKVVHFHGWCKDMCKRFNLSVPSGHWSKASERLAETVCQAVENDTISQGQYHAVLIDEGHDFAPEWLTAMSKMPQPDNEHLLLLYDDAQSIYDNRRGLNFTLSSVGIKARGRTTVLHTNYRNSVEILTASERFILQFLAVSELENDDDIPLLSIQSGGVQTGEYPVFRAYRNIDDECSGIIEKIKVWQKYGVALGDMAVLFVTKKFAESLEKSLKSAGISVNSVITRDEKVNYQSEVDAITLCSIKSSKGSEFDQVILSELGACRDTSDKEMNARLIYVGMTRARKRLFMTASRENAFTRALAVNEFDF